MKLGKFAAIRTGLVLSRKEASRHDNGPYRALSLKNVTSGGQILMSEVDNYFAVEPLKAEYFTQSGDILLRLSAPYTSAPISEKEAGLLVPSHFAIIRVNKTVNPLYLHWWLTKNKKQFYKIASGGAMMGTISSGYVAEMTFSPPPPLEQQEIIGSLFSLANYEQRLLALLGEKKKQLTDALLAKLAN